MSKKKKELSAHKGNKVNQGGRFPFIENFNTWRKPVKVFRVKK